MIPKKLYLFAIALTALLLLIYILLQNYNVNNSDSKQILETDELVVTLTPDGYEPMEFSIRNGTTVTFKNTTGKPHWPASNLHPTHEIYSDFDPQRPLAPDEEWSFTFNQTGTWNFHDHIRSYYSGTVYVSE